jgi:hypothetical protein
MSNDYTIVLKALLNDADVKKQIAALQGEVNRGLTAGATGAGRSTSPAADATKVAEAARNSSAEIAIMAAGWKSAGVAVTEYTKGGVAGMDTLYKATAKVPLALDKTSQITAQVNQRTGELAVSQRTLNNQLDITADKTKNIGTQMLNNIVKFAQWTLAATVVAGGLRAIGNAIQYIQDLNKSMTETQVVTGETDAQIGVLAQRYNSLAGTLGATTKEVAAGALEWRRQGKDVEESLQLTTASIMMSKLANMESADATEKLTATLNGFQMKATDVVSVIDRLVKYCQNA